jgi:hypothetical protein
MTDAKLISVASWFAVAGLLIVYGQQNHQISKLQRENDCLRHPERWVAGQSSASAVRINGKFQVTYAGRTVTCK